jgi:hypothetical protein
MAAAAPAIFEIAAESGEFQAAVGEAGKSLDALAEKMGGKTSEHAKSMGKSIKDAMDKAGEAINAVMSKLASGDMGASNTTEALAAGLSKLAGVDLGPVVELTNKIKENLLAMENLSHVTGVTAGTFTEIKDAMEEAGIPSDKLDSQLTSLRESMGKVQSGSDETKKAFEGLGISTDGWKNKVPPTMTVVAELADRLRNSKTPALDLANAHTILGDQYQNFVTYLKRGSKALADDMRAHKDHGQAVDESIESAKELQREEAALSEKLQLLLLPAFRFVVAVVQQVVAAFISLKGILINVGTLVTGVARIIADSFRGVTTVLGSIAAHWRDLLKGDFSGIAADAKAAFKQIADDYTGTMVSMVQTADQTDKELDAFFNHQLKSDADADNKHTNIVRTGAKQRQVITLEAHQSVIKSAKDTGETVDVDWQQAMAVLGNDTKAQGKVISDLLIGIPKPLPPALAKMNTQTTQIMQSVSQNMANSFSSAIRGMIDGTQTLSAAFAKMGQQMMQSLESALEKMLSDWLQHHIMELLIHTQTKESELATDETASAQSKAISMKEHMSQVFMAAKQAAVNAWTAMSHIPVVGPALGAAAAAATFAAVMAFGSVTSAQGGFYEVDRDQLAFIHKKEMVLPAGIADRLRTTVAGGGGGDSGMNVNVFHNVNAIDAASFKDTIKQHGNMIGNEVARVLKRKGLSGK